MPDLVSAEAYEAVAEPTCVSAVVVSWRAAGQVPGKLYEGGALESGASDYEGVSTLSRKQGL